MIFMFLYVSFVLPDSADIDECYERTDDCLREQMCINTEGGFECSCFPPEIIVNDQCFTS